MAINGFGAVCTAIVMMVFAITKFQDGAYVVIILIPLLVFVFWSIHRHYRHLAKRAEGPWPGRKDAAFVAAGPGTLDANFSHAFVAIGLGMRFASGAQ